MTKCLGVTTFNSVAKGKVEGFYKKAPVSRINGEDAIELVHGINTLDKNHFVLMYHPKCPDDQQMFPEFNEFAKDIASKHADVEVDVVNMSKTS